MDKTKITDLIKNYGKTIHFSRTNKVYSINSSPDDEFMLDIEVAVAKKFSNDVSRKTKMGMIEKVEQQAFPHTATFGYINRDGEIYKDEKIAPFVVKLFELVSTEHYSLSAAGNALYDLGLRNPHKGKHFGKKLSLETLKRAIQNPFYYGAFKWKGKLYKGKHEPIVSKDLWDKANAVLKSIYRHYTYDGSDYYFSRLLRCAECSHSITGAHTIKNRKNPEKAKDYRYYRCENQVNHKIKGYISEQELADTAFLLIVKAVSIPKDITNVLQEAVRVIAGKNSFIKQNKRAILQAEYNDTLKQMDRLYDLQPQGKGSNLDIFVSKEKDLSDTIARLKAKLTFCNTNEEEVVQKAKSLFFAINELEQIYRDSNYEDKSLIIKEICGISTLKLKTKEVTPNYNTPFDVLAGINTGIQEEILDLSDLTLEKLIGKSTDFKSCSKNIWGQNIQLFSNEYRKDVVAVATEIKGYNLDI